jgi:Domain of Unknown Function with PDB structure (DUF3857)/Transglutaminase-like superfamily
MVSQLKTYRLVLLPLFALMLWASPGWAADWPAVTPQDLQMTDLPQQRGAPAVILLREEVANDPQNYHSVYMRIKILTEAGRRYADVEIPYLRRSFKIDSISGRTMHADGSIVMFDGKVFDKMVVKERRGRGEVRVHVKSFTLPDVQVGSILDFRYSIRYDDHQFFAPEWIVQQDLFQKSASFKFIPYSGELIMAHGRVGRGTAWTAYLPSGVKPEWHRLLTSSLATSRTATQYIDLSLNDVPSLIEEPFMPPAGMLRYRVQFYYTIDRTAEVFWKEEGKFWSKDVEKFLDRKSGIEEAVGKTVLASDTPEQKVRKIYALVTGLENQSYRPKREEQEEKVIGLKPNEGVEDVLRQHSGGHDDLNRLMVAMVRAAGIPAFMMWVPSRDETFFQPELMSTHQLDAEIVIVQLGGKDVFLDPGTKFCPYGLLDWRYSDSKGLRQSANKSTEIAESPIPDYTKAQILRLAQVQLSDDGKVEGTIKIGYYGLEAMKRRQKAYVTDAEGRKKMLEDEIRSWLPGNSDVELVGTPNWDDTEPHLATEFKISSPLAVGAGKRWLLPVHLFQVNEKPVFSSSTRVNPIYFWYLTRQIDEVHITLPASFEVESLPSSDSIKLDYAVYSTTQKQESANSILARRDLVMGGLAFPTNLYKEIRDFYDKVKAGDDQQLIVKGSAHAEVR